MKVGDLVTLRNVNSIKEIYYKEWLSLIASTPYGIVVEIDQEFCFVLWGGDFDGVWCENENMEVINETVDD